MGIIVENVTQAYGGTVALDNVSLEIDDGDFAALLGPTGAGKTSLLRIMAGIERPGKGRVYFDGQDVTNVPVQKRSVSFVYQQFVNYPSMTLYENIASPLRVSRKRLSRTEIDNRVRTNAELLGIGGVLHHYPEEVSGGERQRCALARALTKEARFIFLDEPLTNLDYKLREELRGELKHIFRSKGGVIVYATPEPVDALSMATHVAVLHQGSILQYGLADEVYRNPACVEVGAYFSYPAMNLFDCEVRRENGGVYLRVSEGLEIDVSRMGHRLEAKSYVVGIRAHALSTVRESDAMIPVNATVELSEVVGSDTELHLTHRGIRLIVLMQKVVSYGIGEEIEVYLDPQQLYLFDTESRKLVAKTSTD